MSNSPLYTALKSVPLDICSEKRKQLLYIKTIRSSSLCLFIVAVVDKPWGRQIYNEVETLTNLYDDNKTYICFSFLITENMFDETYTKYVDIINDLTFTDDEVLEMLQKWSILKICLHNGKIETTEPIDYLKKKIQSFV